MVNGYGETRLVSHVVGTEMVMQIGLNLFQKKVLKSVDFKKIIEYYIKVVKLNGKTNLKCL